MGGHFGVSGSVAACVRGLCEGSGDSLAWGRKEAAPAQAAFITSRGHTPGAVLQLA